MTTLADIQAGQIGWRWVLLIEGCEFALCSRDPSTIASYLETASWDWDDAIDGLMVLGGWEQSLEPWETSIQVGRLSFAVSKGVRSSTGEESDAFAEIVFGNGNGGETYLETALDCNDTTVTVKSTAAVVGAATSGTIHIGTEAIAFTGVTATTFTGCTRGKFAPFKANTEASQRYGQPHRIASVGDSVIVPPKVTSKQRDWTGRRVGLYMLSDSSTAWSDRRLVWAGKIEAIRDGANGLTYLECIDIKAQIRDCILMRHQFRGTMREGVYLLPGWKFDASDSEAGSSLSADALVVKTGASGSNELEAGRYSLDELATAINEWLANEKTAGNLNLDWSWSPAIETAQGPRSLFRWSSGSSTSTNDARFFAHQTVCEFMGILDDTVNGSDPQMRMLWRGWEDDAEHEFASSDEPFRHLMTVYEPFTITVENIAGDLFDNREVLPDLGFGSLSSSVEWAVLQFGDGPMALAQVDTATDTQVDFAFVASSHKLDEIAGTDWSSRPGARRTDRVRYSEPLDLEVKQVAIIGGRQLTSLTKLIASTGTAGYNHAIYDALPQQLGAGVPWELLGTGWTTSFTAFNTGQVFRDTLVIEKPTSLMSVVGAGLVARVAQIIWKDEGLRVTSWGTPTAARALHAFTETNKAISGDAKDPQRVAANQTDDFLVNLVHIKYGRGSYEGDYTIVDPASQDTYSGRGKEVDLPSITSFGNVADIADDLQTMIPMFSRPLHIITRTVNPTFYEGMAPGDFCTISDNHARDLATGTRGLSSKPGLITRTSIDWGGFDDSGEVRPPHGEVDILVLPISNIAAYSACAEVDSGAANGGYDVATQTLTLLENEHTEAADGTDIEFLCADNDAGVTVVEIDPADPTSPLIWQGNGVDSFNVGANTITLVDPLTGWDNTKRYRVIPNYYNGGLTTEQQAHVFVADDADGMIVDTAGAYVYGTDTTQAGTWTDDAGTEQVALWSEVAAADGAPLDVGYEKDAARLINNLVNYRTAVISPHLERGVLNYASFTGSSNKAILAVYPIALHPGAVMLGDRSIYVRPMFRSNDGSSVTISVSLCANPPTGVSNENGDPDAPQYSLGSYYETLTWSTSSTTWGYGSEKSFSSKTVDGVTGIVFLVVETNSTKLETRGLPEVWQGAYDEAA